MARLPAREEASTRDAGARVGEGGARLVGRCLYRRDCRPPLHGLEGALIGLARSLAGPLALYGVTVNAVAPALIKRGETLPGDEESREQLAARVPVGRLGRPEEVAEIVHALVTNPFVTAQTVSVDGGMHPH
jgi:hypothetical protein